MKSITEHFKYLQILGLSKGLYLIMTKIMYRLLADKSHKLASFFLNKKHRIILNYLRLLNDKSSTLYLQQKPKIDIDENVIWLFWWQGETAMPDIVRICYESVLLNSSGYDVRLLTKDNVTTYLDLPIIDRVGKGMSYTNLSDYVRLNILAIYGGGWIDATCFITRDISAEMLKYHFFTVRHSRRSFYCISEFRWGVSYLFAKRNNLLITNVCRLFDCYWLHNRNLIDYFLIDYCFAYFVESNSECKKILENVSYSNPLMYEGGIMSNMNNEFSLEHYSSMVSDTWIHKLSWKHPFVDNVEGKQTLYGWLKSRYMWNR